MKRVGRLGDKAHIDHDMHGCPACDHAAEGPAIAGSPDVFVNKRPVLRVDDRGIHAACCGLNRWKAIEGSSTVFANGHSVHRVDDRTRHCGGIGKLIEGSGNVFAGGGGGVSQSSNSNTGTWYRGTDTATAPNGRWMDFYAGKIASGRAMYLESAGTDVSALLQGAYDDAGFEQPIDGFFPFAVTSNDSFQSSAALPETQRNYGYAVMSGYYHSQRTSLTADQLTTNATRWGRLQGLIAVAAVLHGPYSSHIAGTTLFADIESETPPQFSKIGSDGKPMKDANGNAITEPGITTVDQRRLVLEAWLDAVASSGLTPGIYTAKHYWVTYFGDASWTPSRSFVLWHSMCPSDAGGSDPDPPSDAVLSKLFGSSPPPVAVFGGQQPVIWQRYVGAGDYDVSVDNPMTGFSPRSYASTDDSQCFDPGGNDWIDQAEQDASKAHTASRLPQDSEWLPGI